YSGKGSPSNRSRLLVTPTFILTKNVRLLIWFSFHFWKILRHRTWEYASFQSGLNKPIWKIYLCNAKCPVKGIPGIPQFLEAENIPVLAWPAYSPDMSPIEHVWDALDRRIRQRVPGPANIQQLPTAIEEEWINIPQATINNLINSMQRRCFALRETHQILSGLWPA
uniref:Tc1-like transposase DDE domain-containing protein n=1 Tax=Esox lucius TaxID=8010 RepID=A0AAY5L537_ESOLU